MFNCFARCVGVGVALLVVGGCGKQASEHREERLLAIADATYQKMASKYSDEIALLDGDCEPDKIKSKIEDIILRKPYKKQTALSVFWYGEDPRSPEKIPFHTYVNELASDLKMLKSARKGLGCVRIQNVTVGDSADHIQALEDCLDDVKAYATSHREFRDEERYLRLVPR
ncbi:MAG: hypothetical protein WCW33_00565 [Candidatus Babeliales bacterium]|jgi:hypothetical protein